MFHYIKVLSAIAAWTLGFTLAFEADVANDWGLAIFVITVAYVPTFWLMLDAAAAARTKALREIMREERVHTEQLVLAVAAEFARAELPQIEARRRG